MVKFVPNPLRSKVLLSIIRNKTGYPRYMDITLEYGTRLRINTRQTTTIEIGDWTVPLENVSKINCTMSPTICNVNRNRIEYDIYVQ